MEAHAKDVPDNRTLPRVGVSGEMIAILAVGVMLAGLVFTTGSWIRDDLRDDMQILRDDLRGDMRVLRDEVRSVQSGLSELRERVVRVEERLVGVEERGARVESGLGEVDERVIRIESLLQEDSTGLQG